MSFKDSGLIRIYLEIVRSYVECYFRVTLQGFMYLQTRIVKAVIFFPLVLQTLSWKSKKEPRDGKIKTLQNFHPVGRQEVTTPVLFDTYNNFR